MARAWAKSRATPLTGCTEYVGNVPAQNGSPAAIGVPVTSIGGTTPAPNVFQGVVSGNTVTFSGVPILPPSTTGNRIYRITNIRANANAIGGGALPGSISGSISISQGLTINQFTFTLATVQAGLTTSLRNAANTGTVGPANLSPCGIGGPPEILRYSETFSTAFKSRTTLGFGNASPTSAFAGQNIPGQIYNAESGFTLGALSNGGTIAGLADWGTRLKAVFSNVPSGVSIYVSTVNVLNVSTASGTAAGSPTAVLLTGETIAEGAGAAATGSSGTVPYAPVTIVNGTGIAVWELTGNNYSNIQNLDFAVFTQTLSPAPGSIWVSMSYAPNPTNGAFNAAGAADPTQVSLLPRFADTSLSNLFAEFTGCATGSITGPNNSTYGQAVTFTATAQTTALPAVPVTYGTFTFLDATTSATLQPATAPNSNGQVGLTVSSLAAGNHQILAVFNPGTGPGPPFGLSWPITVGKAPLTVTANSGSRVYGAPNPSLGAIITGFVNGDPASVVSGAASFATSAAVASPPGSYPITASAGTLAAANYSFSPVNGSLTVVKASTFITLTLSAGNLYANVGIVPPGSGTPIGTVQFLNGGSVIGTQPYTGSAAMLQAPPGNAPFTAVYSGDGNFSGSVSNAVTNLVLPPPQATSIVSIGSSANPSTLGQSVTFTASVGTAGSAPSAGPTGSVQFSDGSKSLCSSSLSGGQATCTASTLTGGGHSITAQYSGDTLYSGASASYPQTVLAPETVTVTASPAAPVFGQTVVLTANVTATAPSGFAAPTGQVTFQDAGALFMPNTTLGVASLASGTATFSLNTLSVGTHTIIAAYSGDATWPSNSKTTTVAIAPAPTTTTLSLSLNSAGQALLTATVVPVTQGISMPTGSVQFMDTSNAAMVATAALSGGTAAATEPANAVSHPLDAVYSGDANFKGSVSAPLPVTANAAASLSASFAPDELASLFNITGLNGDTPATLPLTTSLGGVTVKITDSAGTGHMVQLYGVFASTGQINFVIPGDTAAGTALVTITLPGGGMLTAIATIAKSAAGIFTANMGGQGVFAGQVLYVHADGSQTIANPVTGPIDFGPAGDQVFLVLYGTGLRHAASLTATVNGVPVPVLFFGAQGQYTGMDQINLSLPRSLAGAGLVNIVITADGQPANVVDVAIR